MAKRKSGSGVEKIVGTTAPPVRQLKFKAPFLRESDKYKDSNVVICTSAFGEPGVDIWVGEKCLQLDGVQSLDLRDLLQFEFGHCTREGIKKKKGAKP